MVRVVSTDDLNMVHANARCGIVRSRDAICILAVSATCDRYGIITRESYEQARLDLRTPGYA